MPRSCRWRIRVPDDVSVFPVPVWTLSEDVYKLERRGGELSIEIQSPHSSSETCREVAIDIDSIKLTYELFHHRERLKPQLERLTGNTGFSRWCENDVVSAHCNH